MTRPVTPDGQWVHKGDLPCAARGAGLSAAHLQYLGHAGFVLRAAGITVLLDPWFFPAFAQSWFPYPDNRHLLPSVLSERVDFLYVSHTHSDHFDRRVLAAMSKDVTVLCADFRSRSLERGLRSLGFERLLLMGHGEEVQLAPGVDVRMILDTSHKEDSGLLIDARGFRLLDLNDCHCRLGDLPDGVDLLAAQFSGASWYPDCYEYPPEVAQAKISAAKANQIATLGRIVEATEARCYLPSAGPPCFLDRDLRRLNDHHRTTFVQWEDVEAAFATACPKTTVARMEPGQVIELAATDLVCSSRLGHRVDAPLCDFDSYADRRCDEWDLDRTCIPVTIEEIRGHFARLVRRNQDLVIGIDTQMSIITGLNRWIIHIGGDQGLEVREAAPDDAFAYTLSLPDWLLRRIVDGELDWEEGLLSMRITLRREPDVFDARLFGLLRYGTNPAQTRQLALDNLDADEMVKRDGIEHQRYCPHAGEDLLRATLCDGVLECPRHHWRWDVRTGSCLSGGSLPLRVTVTDEKAACLRSDHEHTVGSPEPLCGDQLVGVASTVSSRRSPP